VVPVRSWVVVVGCHGRAPRPARHPE